MTSRERVKAALNHRQPDRVPVDFGSTIVTGMHVSVVSRLRKAFGLGGAEDRVKVIEPFQMLGEIDEGLREKLCVDFAPLFHKKNVFGFENKDWKNWTLFDDSMVLVPGLFNTVTDEKGDILLYPEGDCTAPPSARMPRDGMYFDSILRQAPIYENALDPHDNVEEYGPISRDEIERLGKESERLYTGTDYALVYSLPGTSLGDISDIPGPGLKHPKGIRGEEEWYVSTLARRDYVYEALNLQCEIGLENLARVRDALGDRIEVIKVSGADFGSQRGPLFSPDLYRDLFKPFHARICDWIHSHTPWKVFVHTCGGIRPLLPDIIDAGFDILNPVQTSAEGMEAGQLKHDFGDRIVFWGGGIDTQKTLPFGTPEEVYHEVRQNIQIFNRDGGYIFNAIHNIQPGTPLENITAMLEAIRDSWCLYPETSSG
jgi:hypothetical protein